MPPVIPTYIGTNAFPDRPPNSDIQPGSYGKDAEALQRVGGDIGQLGEQLLAARKQASDQDYINAKSTDAIISDHQTQNAITASYNKNNVVPQGAPIPDVTSVNKNTPNDTPTLNSDVKLNTRNPDSSPVDPPMSRAGGPIGATGNVNYDPTGRSDLIRQQQIDRMNQDLAAAPSEGARRKYQQIATNRINDMYVRNLAEENKDRVLAQQANVFNANDKIAEDLNAHPDMGKLTMSLQNLRDSLNASASGPAPLFDPQQANVIYEKAAAQLVTSTFEGASNDPDAARSFMDHLKNAQLNQKGYEQINNALGPAEFKSLHNQLQSSITTDANQKITEIDRKNTSRMAAINSADPAIMASYYNDTQVRKDLAQLDKLAADPYTKLEPDKVDETRLNMAIGMAGYKVASQIAAIPPDQREARVALYQSKVDAVKNELGITEKSTGAQEAIKVKSMIDGAINGYDAEFKKDPAKYVATYVLKEPPLNGANPGENTLQKRADAIKQFGGDPSKGLYMADELAARRTQIGKEQDPEKAAQLVMQLKNDSGRFAGSVFQQLDSGKGGLGDQYRRASFMDDKDAAVSIITNAKQAPELKALIGPVDHTAVVNQVAMATQREVNAIAAGGKYADSSRIAKGLRDDITTEAMLQVSKNIPIPYAVQNAKDKFFNNNSMVIGGTVVPRKVGDTTINQQNVEAEFSLAHNAQWMKAQGPLVAKGHEDEFYNALPSGQWITDPDRAGATFNIMQNKRWTPVQIQNGGPEGDKINPQLDKHSNVLHRNFEQATLNPSAEAVAAKTSLQMKASKAALEGAENAFENISGAAALGQGL